MSTIPRGTWAPALLGLWLLATPTLAWVGIWIHLPFSATSSDQPSHAVAQWWLLRAAALAATALPLAALVSAVRGRRVVLIVVGIVALLLGALIATALLKLQIAGG